MSKNWLIKYVIARKKQQQQIIERLTGRLKSIKFTFFSRPVSLSIGFMLYFTRLILI